MTLAVDTEHIFNYIRKIGIDKSDREIIDKVKNHFNISEEDSSQFVKMYFTLSAF